jgi:CTP:molybdopterin cytidylyltransferase MocA
MRAIILAAGQSTRLGEPKILVNYQGKTLLEKTCLLALNACDDVLILLGSETQKSIEVIESLQTYHRGLQYSICPDWSQGMGSTLAYGLRLMKDFEDDVMVMLCDLPFLEDFHLSHLVSIYRSFPTKVIISCFKGQNSPPIIIPFALQAEFYDWHGERGLGSFWSQNKALCAMTNFETAYRDLDTKEDKEFWTKN